MMSVLPGETTKQIRLAPAFIIRSTKYSPTARGRSRPASIRLPTGKSSLENAKGWIRDPIPAAGTMPQIRVMRWPPQDSPVVPLAFQRYVLREPARERVGLSLLTRLLPDRERQ